MNTVFDDPIWGRLKGYARISINRSNLDLLHLPDELRSKALMLGFPCVACGQVIQVFRARVRSGRSRIAGQVEEHRLFYAATCPAAVNPGCSRSRAAKDHKRRLRDMLDVKREAKKTVLIKIMDASGMAIINLSSELLEPIKFDLPRDATMIGIMYEEK